MSFPFRFSFNFLSISLSISLLFVPFAYRIGSADDVDELVIFEPLALEALRHAAQKADFH